MRMYILPDGYWKLVHKSGKHIETKSFTLALMVMLKTQHDYKWNHDIGMEHRI